MPAGDNEKKFESLILNKFGYGCLKGKKTFSLKLPGHDKTRISVDQSIELEDGSVLLFEIDSGNMAKLIAGQYALLNGMYVQDRSKAHFVVIHYYKNYNSERTLKNLNAIQHFNGNTDWISYSAYNENDFIYMVNNTTSIEELIQKIWPNRVN